MLMRFNCHNFYNFQLLKGGKNDQLKLAEVLLNRL